MCVQGGKNHSEKKQLKVTKSFSKVRKHLKICRGLKTCVALKRTLSIYNHSPC